MEAKDWTWQVKNTITSAEKLKKYIPLTPKDEQEILGAEKKFRWRITPYYAEHMDPEDAACPLRLQAVPSTLELHDPDGVMDPLLEEEHVPAPNIIKVYPDRIAWTVSNICPVLCRHCLRKRMVGRENFDFSREAREAAFDYIRGTPEIRDVLLTGGDPLMYNDDMVEELVAKLREIPHVEIIRLGTRALCTMPQRITPALANMLKKYHPLYVNTQFNHPKELTDQARRACALLADAGIPLGNQSVLLKGINDDPEVMKELVQKLLAFRVKPYYLYQAQLLEGTAHFRTPIESGIRIIENLRGFTSGMSVPRYVLDTPYGKVPMAPNYIEKRDDQAVYLRNFEGKVWREPNPRPRPGTDERA
jgi:lysine 2,3-aminomutase